MPGRVYYGRSRFDDCRRAGCRPGWLLFVSRPGGGPGGSRQILHYSKAGVFEMCWARNDAIQAPLEFPGTLAFGPNGNLYVADLYARAVFTQFDISWTTQQYLAANTIQLPQGFSPASFVTFAADATHDLIVGAITIPERSCNAITGQLHDARRRGQRPPALRDADRD